MPHVRCPALHEREIALIAPWSSDPRPSLLRQAIDAGARPPVRRPILCHDDHHPDIDSGAVPLLLVHGAVQSRAIWDTQVKRLSGRRRVVVPDLRGHGATPLGSDRLSVGSMADDCAALLDALDIRRVVVVGVSLGGMVALELARRHPARVEAIVLSNTPRALIVNRWLRRGIASLRPQRLLVPLFALAGRRRTGWLGLAIGRWAVGPHWVGRTARAHFLDGFARMPTRAIVATYRAIVECEPVDPQRVRCTCLVVEGSDDVDLIHDQAAELARRAPRAFRLRMRAGHVAPLDDPERFDAVLTRFLASLPSS